MSRVCLLFLPVVTFGFLRETTRVDLDFISFEIKYTVVQRILLLQLYTIPKVIIRPPVLSVLRRVTDNNCCSGPPTAVFAVSLAGVCNYRNILCRKRTRTEPHIRLIRNVHSQHLSEES